jgi:hypothetical protein
MMACIAGWDDPVCGAGAGQSGTNLAPSVNAGNDQSVVIPAQASLHGSASDDGNPSPPGSLTISWSKVSGPGEVIFSNPSIPSTSATFNAEGTYVLRVTAFDGELTRSDDVQVIAYSVAPNQAPSVDAGSDQTITLPANTVDLQGIVSDDGLPSASLTYGWAVDPAAGVTIGNPAALFTSATLPGEGLYNFTLSASDSALSAHDSMLVRVLETGDSTLQPIEAEDYKPGGEGIGYHDTSVPNYGNSTYRGDSVDMSRVGSTIYITDFSVGEWLAYDITIPQDGDYEVVMALKLGVTGTRRWTIYIDGIDATGQMNFIFNQPTVWTDYTANLTLGAGVHEIRFMPNMNGVYFDKFSISQPGGSGPQASASMRVSVAASDEPFSESCTIDSARWSSDVAIAGQEVEMTVEASGCDGQDIELSFYEDDLYEDRSLLGITGNYMRSITGWISLSELFDNIVQGFRNLLGIASDEPAPVATADDDLPIQSPIYVRVEDNMASSVFNAVWIEDIGGSDSDPEIYFVAKHGESQKRSGTLKISRQAPVPSIDPHGGIYESNARVVLSVEEPGFSIRYSLDGSTPTEESTLYTGPFLLVVSTMVRARAFAPGYLPSEVNTVQFVLNIDRPQQPLPDAMQPEEPADGPAEAAVQAPAGETLSQQNLSQAQPPQPLIDAPAPAANQSADTAIPQQAIPPALPTEPSQPDEPTDEEDQTQVTEPQQPVNVPPTITVDQDAVIQLPDSLSLTATVTDDGLMAALSFQWTKLSGPGSVSFSAQTASTTLSFSEPGTYVVQVMANDGELSAYDQIQVVVEQQPTEEPVTDTLDDGLIAFWKFDNEASPQTDSAGNGIVLEAQGSPAYTSAGKKNGAVVLDGVDDSYTSPDVSDLSFSASSADKPFTMALWIYPEKTMYYIFTKNDYTVHEYRVYVETSGKLHVRLYSYTGYIDVLSTGTVPTGRWVHLAVAYDGSRQSSGIKLYMDGSIMPAVESKGGTYLGQADTAGKFHFGFFQPSADIKTHYIKGKVDDVRIYSRQLTAAEIASLAS